MPRVAELTDLSPLAFLPPATIALNCTPRFALGAPIATSSVSPDRAWIGINDYHASRYAFSQRKIAPSLGVLATVAKNFLTSLGQVDRIGLSRSEECTFSRTISRLQLLISFDSSSHRSSHCVENLFTRMIDPIFLFSFFSKRTGGCLIFFFGQVRWSIWSYQKRHVKRTNSSDSRKRRILNRWPVEGNATVTHSYSSCFITPGNKKCLA